MNRGSLVFGSTGSWQRAATQTIQVPKLHPLALWRAARQREWLRGWTHAAVDIASGVVRADLPLACTAEEAGYRAAVASAYGREL